MNYIRYDTMQLYIFTILRKIKINFLQFKVTFNFNLFLIILRICKEEKRNNQVLFKTWVILDFFTNNIRTSDSGKKVTNTFRSLEAAFEV